MFGTPFKQRAHYVFNYKPRYFDERKERLKNTKEKRSKEIKEQRIRLSKNSLRNNWAKTKKGSVDTKASRRLAIIIAILIGICAYIFEIHMLI